VTIASQKEYIRKIRDSSHDIILGLFDNKNRLIGSSGVQKINSSETGPWVGIMIGPNEARGFGLGAAFLWVVTYIIFLHYNVGKVFAGMRVNNVASYSTFYKIGYRENIILTKSYISKKINSNRIIVVSCSKDLILPESIGITCVKVLP